MHLPNVWDVPVEIRRRVSQHTGRQRAIEFDGHILLTLYRVPEPRSTFRQAIYLWRSKEGEWKFSEQGSGLSVLSTLLDDYETVITEQSENLDVATLPKQWYAITERLAPINRSIQPLHEAIHETLGLVPDDEKESIQALSDRSNSLARTTELLLADAKNALEFFTANQAYIQSVVNQEQARAAFRLNILAAIFLPLGTIAAVFGMNLRSGLEELPLGVFWSVFAVGAIAGLGIGGYVLNFRPTKLAALLELQPRRMEAK